MSNYRNLDKVTKMRKVLTSGNSNDCVKWWGSEHEPKLSLQSRNRGEANITILSPRSLFHSRPEGPSLRKSYN